jgi:hypothetical protein
VARRSPTNARYQKFQEPAGKTRKSAAAAKPSRKAAGAPASSSKSKSGSSASRSAGRLDPQTPEFRRLRTMWWSLLGGGVVLVTVSWGVRYLDKAGTWFGTPLVKLGQFNLSPSAMLASITLGLAYAAIFYALYLDFYKMRPLRQAYRSGQTPKADKPKAAKADKPTPDEPAE